MVSAILQIVKHAKLLQLNPSIILFLLAFLDLLLYQVLELLLVSRSPFTCVPTCVGANHWEISSDQDLKLPGLKDKDPHRGRIRRRTFLAARARQSSAPPHEITG